MKTQVKINVELIKKITVRVQLPQGSSLSPNHFDLIMDVLDSGIQEQPFFADNIVLCSTGIKVMER